MKKCGRKGLFIMVDGFLRQTIFHNTISSYLISITIFIVGFILIWFLKRIYLHRIKVWVKETETPIDDFIVNAVEKRLLPLAYFGIFYICARGLNLKPIISKGLNIVGLLFLIIVAVRFLLSIFEYSIENYLIPSNSMDLTKQQSIKVIANVIKIIVWSLAVIIILDNFGVKISALMAGLGIGGVAVALASQAVLGDVFNYFTIFFDRPFTIGDFIVVDEYSGTVEHIGVKTTRIRSIGGEQLIFSNTDLTNSRVQNYKRMEQRRALFQFGVTYDTPIEMLEEIPVVIRKIIENFEDTVFDRAHFIKYGDFSLIFEVVYCVLNSDYTRYMDVQHQINLNMMREFKTRNISFASTAQNLFVHQQQPAEERLPPCKHPENYL